MKEDIMKEKYPKYKKHYDVALKLIVACVCIGMFLILFRVGWDMCLIYTAVAAVSAYFFTRLTRKLSFRMLMFGDNLKELWKKIVFYVATPIVSLAVFYALVYGVLFLYEILEKSRGSSLDDIFYILLLELVLVIGVFVPYVQTLVVLVLRKFIRVKSY